MTYILSIESATEICSASLSKDGVVVSLQETNQPNVHSQRLALMIQEIFHESKIHATQLDAVAVSSGPGSYTGLRIGVSIAKGLCYASDIPLIAIPTLESMCYGFPKLADDVEFLVPMIDAGRMEVYTAVFNRDFNRFLKEQPLVIDSHSFSDILKSHKILFFGNGSAKCQNIICSTNAFFSDKGYPSAASLAKVAFEYFQQSKFVDTVYFEPFYLKEFQAKISKVKGLD
ncbi:MAG: tRNA (adenosine(37)-N6)-threonylcarbamoyltransferase complex dimerization subunit type 1 TsaB [Bacteroidales bacterium]|nr:tRNA (adenosine(37)-N6)-threonylcarbamoyltransferase complex dimerization subunit type 1 TsaB [Bacteroidales bacterium]